MHNFDAAMYGLLLFLHILSATIWTGGHIVLSFVILPRALKEESSKLLLDFEKVYEKIGLPALLIQVITGLLLAHRLLPNIISWFTFESTLSQIIVLKLSLLALTLGFALDAKFRVLPGLSNENLNEMAWHIIPVTVISILFVFAGVAFRANWFY